jgi:hypothetical protein
VHGIRRDRRGDGVRVALTEQERELVRQLCERLAAEVEVGADDEGLSRLFPAAYRDDPDAAAEFEQLAGPGLVDGKVAALRRVEATAADERLGAEDAQAWLTALNDVRLVLGTRLGVTEGPDAHDLSHPGYAVYAWLTWLQGELIEALAAAL